MDVTVTVSVFCTFFIPMCFFVFCNVLNLVQDRKCLCVCVCRLGFSVLVYGLGSKKALLEDFRVSHLAQEIHLVVNGFFPSITLKSVSIHTQISLLVQSISTIKLGPIFVVVSSVLIMLCLHCRS